MSGLLRRIKRSRAADAGENPAEGPAAAPAAAPTSEVPAPAIERDPDTPAGLEAGAAVAPPAGRPGRLRRRLRYLRRARELMLRDLGGLVYEVHRSGGGDYSGHGAVIGSKVARLTSLDAESDAIEAALAAPRSETVVFQPGVGGTCDFCGELYSSAARFCSHCGSPTGSAVRATAAVAQPRALQAMPNAPGESAARVLGAVRAADQPALVRRDEIAPGGDEPKPADEVRAADEPTAAEEPKRADEPAAAEEPKPTEAPAAAGEAPESEAPTAEIEPAAPSDQGAAPDEPARNPFSGISNGRTEDDTSPPELSSGDPLASRESRP